MEFYTSNNGSLYGLWILILEVVICGVVPAIILVSGKMRRNQKLLWLAVILACVGVCLNRWVMVLQVLAVPVLPFENWATYLPSWQEVATTILPVAYGIILISLSYRYLPVFPQEAELNPIDAPEPADATAASASLESAEAQASESGGEGDLQPAES
jgi:molybdopterin-containing oxidoreductase family membrane subunit